MADLNSVKRRKHQVKVEQDVGGVDFEVVKGGGGCDYD